MAIATKSTTSSTSSYSVTYHGETIAVGTLAYCMSIAAKVNAAITRGDFL